MARRCTHGTYDPEHLIRVERVKGIEPSPRAWEARVLPLNYTRAGGFAPCLSLVSHEARTK